jgi:hypothetical protein
MNANDLLEKLQTDAVARIANELEGLEFTPVSETDASATEADAAGEKATVEAKPIEAPKPQPAPAVSVNPLRVALTDTVEAAKLLSKRKIHTWNPHSSDRPGYRGSVAFKQALNLTRQDTWSEEDQHHVVRLLREAKKGLAHHSIALTFRNDGHADLAPMEGAPVATPKPQPKPQPAPRQMIPVGNKASTQTSGLSLTDLAIAKLQEVGEAGLNNNQKRIIAALLK